MPTRPRRGFAVIDFETTGFSPRTGDRIVEIGVICLDTDLRIDGGMETLVDPQRGVGPTHVHGIGVDDVVGAPTIELVLPHLLEILDGRIVVGHNVAFDLRFLTAEIERAGMSVPDIVFLDTLRLAKSGFIDDRLVNYKLPTLADYLGLNLTEILAEVGLDNRPAHSALGDAVLTSRVLSAMIEQHPNDTLWENELDRAEATAWPLPWKISITGRTRAELPSFVSAKAPEADVAPPHSGSTPEEVVDFAPTPVAAPTPPKPRSWWRRLFSAQA